MTCTAAAAGRPPTHCPTCGFESESLAPADAIVAVRSLPRRYAELLATPGDDDAEREAVVTRRPGSEGLSAVDVASHVAETLHGAARVLPSAAHGTATMPTAAPLGPGDASSMTATAAVKRAADELAANADRLSGDDWVRREGGSASALDVLLDAVHEGTHHLRDVRRIIDAALHERG